MGPSYESQVLAKLTAIAWFTGIVAVVTIISVVAVIVNYSYARTGH